MNANKIIKCIIVLVSFRGFVSCASNAENISKEEICTMIKDKQDLEFQTVLQKQGADMEWQSALLGVPNLIATLGSLMFMAHDSNFYMTVNTSVGNQKLVNRSMDYHVRVEMLVNTAIGAFRNADRSMNEIKQLTGAIQNLAIKSARILYNGTEKDVSLIPRVLTLMQTEAKRCGAIAENTTKYFDDVMTVAFSLSMDVLASESGSSKLLANISNQLNVTNIEMQTMKDSYKRAQKQLAAASKEQMTKLREFLTAIENQPHPSFLLEIFNEIFDLKPPRIPSVVCFHKLSKLSKEQNVSLDDKVDMELNDQFLNLEIESLWKLLQKFSSVFSNISNHRQNSNVNDQDISKLNVLRKSLLIQCRSPSFSYNSKRSKSFESVRKQSLEEMNKFAIVCMSNSTTSEILKNTSKIMKTLSNQCRKLREVDEKVCHTEFVTSDMDNSQFKLHLKEKLLDNAEHLYEEQFKKTLLTARNLDRLMKENVELKFAKSDSEKFHKQAKQAVLLVNSLRKAWKDIAQFSAHISIITKENVETSAKIYGEYVGVHVKDLHGNPNLYNHALANITLKNSVDSLMLSVSLIKFFSKLYTNLSSDVYIPPLEKLKVLEFQPNGYNKNDTMKQFFKHLQKHQYQILERSQLEKTLFHSNLAKLRLVIKNLYPVTPKQDIPLFDL